VHLLLLRLLLLLHLLLLHLLLLLYLWLLRHLMSLFWPQSQEEQSAVAKKGPEKTMHQPAS
jgi:hypothetical protein